MARERLPLLTSQRNDVLTAILDAGFQPSEFEWKHTLSAQDFEVTVDQLHFRDSAFYYQFDFKQGDHYAYYSPAEQKIASEDYPGDWKTQLAYFSRWLRVLKRETEAPDLWARILATPLPVPTSPGFGTANEPFSPPERLAVERTLKELQHFLRESALTTESQLTTIDDRLAYLEHATERLGRKDWLNVAIGVIVNLVAAAVIPPDLARDAMGMTWNGLQWLIAGNPLLPTALE